MNKEKYGEKPEVKRAIVKTVYASHESSRNSKMCLVAQSAGAVEYTDCVRAEG